LGLKELRVRVPATAGHKGLRCGRKGCSRVERLEGRSVEWLTGRQRTGTWEERTENGEERIERWHRTSAPRSSKKSETCRGGIGEKPNLTLQARVTYQLDGVNRMGKLDDSRGNAHALLGGKKIWQRVRPRQVTSRRQKSRQPAAATTRPSTPLMANAAPML
jgi:hypothetical protein